VLGSGIGGFPFAEAARIMVGVIREHGEAHELPEDVVLYGYNETDAAALRRVVEER